LLRDQLQQRGFSLAVTAQQANALAPDDVQVDGVKQGFEAET